MEESILSVTPGATVKEAAELMHKNSISSLLVGEAESYSGFLTDTDLTRKLVAKNRDSKQTSVAAIASASVISNDVRYIAITSKSNVKGIILLKDFTIYYKQKHINTNELGESSPLIFSLTFLYKLSLPSMIRSK